MKTSRLRAARTLASDGNNASIAEPLHEAEEDHATIRNVFGSERFLPTLNSDKARPSADAELLMANSSSGMSDGQSAWRLSTQQRSASAITALTRSVREIVI